MSSANRHTCEKAASPIWQKPGPCRECESEKRQQEFFARLFRKSPE